MTEPRRMNRRQRRQAARATPTAAAQTPVEPRDYAPFLAAVVSILVERLEPEKREVVITPADFARARDLGINAEAGGWVLALGDRRRTR